MDYGDRNANEDSATNPSVEYYEKPVLEKELRDAIADEVSAILKATLSMALKEAIKEIEKEKNEARGERLKKETEGPGIIEMRTLRRNQCIVVTTNPSGV
ncbi:hypothetical protein L1987_08858 [Smallanthus sonchifolius]|uniref:Uncharacterized protein n=1 Tax=Smallanthus sonchifolius TaxID=185202 RepID=A0ACB9JLU4_9ASTR|nr:hypothetical protein L1987_08858 [Smallanthus sonchifolius]